MPFAKRRLRRWRDPHRIEPLLGWAEFSGWRAGDFSDLELAEEANRVVGLTGEPGEEVIRGVDGYAAPGSSLGQIELGAILSRETSAGKLLLVDCWRDSGAEEPHTLASLATGTELNAFTLDLGHHATRASGRLPPLGAGRRLAELLANLCMPVRLRLLAGRI